MLFNRIALNIFYSYKNNKGGDDNNIVTCLVYRFVRSRTLVPRKWLQPGIDGAWENGNR